MASNTALGRYFFDRCFNMIELFEQCRRHFAAFVGRHCPECCLALCREPERTGLLAEVVNSNRFGGLCMMAAPSDAACAQAACDHMVTCCLGDSSERNSHLLHAHLLADI